MTVGTTKCWGVGCSGERSHFKARCRFCSSRCSPGGDPVSFGKPASPGHRLSKHTCARWALEVLWSGLAADTALPRGGWLKLATAHFLPCWRGWLPPLPLSLAANPRLAHGMRLHGPEHTMGCPALPLSCEDRTQPRARHASLCLIYCSLPASIYREKPSGVKGGDCPDRAAWIWSTPGCEGSRAGIGEPSIASLLRPPAWAPPSPCLLLPDRALKARQMGLR